MATYGNEQMVPLPCWGANLQLNNGVSIMRHERPKPTKDYAAKVDKEAYAAHLAEVQAQRKEVYDNSDYHTPIELYSGFAMPKHKNDFLVAESPDGNWLVELGDNWLYVYDAAELATLAGRTIDYEFMTEHVQPTDAGKQSYEEQVSRLSQQYAAKVTQLEPTNRNATVYEVYDERMQLLAICANATVIEKEFGVPHSTVADAARNHNLCHGKYYFREFYDNNFTIKNKFPFEQVMDGKVVNRFATVKDAAKALDIPEFAIYRLIRTPNKIDQYGCHWRKNKG